MILLNNRIFLCIPFLLMASCDGTSEIDASPQVTNNQPNALIPLTPDENDRFSQLTGLRSDQAIVIVDSEEETISEDARYTANFFISKQAYINVQIDHRSGPTGEIFTLDQNNNNKYQAGSNFDRIENLSFSPLSSDFSSEWTLLSPGSYNVVVDNTDRGSVRPPFNFVNDRLSFTLSVLATPEYADEQTLVFNDAPQNSVDTKPIAQLREITITRVIEEEGF